MEGYSEKTGAPCEEGEHRAAVKLAQTQKEKTTQALCVHVYVRSLERETEMLKWRYSRQYGGGGVTPKFKEAGAPVFAPPTHTHTHITSLHLLIALCCFVFLPLPVFFPFNMLWF